MGSQADPEPAQCFPESTGTLGLGGAGEGGALLQCRPLRHKGLGPLSPGPNFLRGDRSGPREPLVRDSGQPGAAMRGSGAPRAQTSEKPPLLLGSTNTGFRASSFLAKSWACEKRWGKGRPSCQISDKGPCPGPARPLAAWGSPPHLGHTEGGRTRQNSRLFSMTG